MQTRTQRGRAAKGRSQAHTLRRFYTILGIVVIVGVAIIAGTVLSTRQPSAANVAAGSTPLDATLPSKGSADAPVTIVEYADFQCPGCAYFSTQIEAQFTRDYIDTGKVRLLYHDFPLTQHQNAIVSAEAARAAGDQGAFWPMHDLLFAKQAEWGTSPNPGAVRQLRRAAKAGPCRLRADHGQPDASRCGGECAAAGYEGPDHADANVCDRWPAVYDAGSAGGDRAGAGGQAKLAER